METFRQVGSNTYISDMGRCKKNGIIIEPKDGDYYQYVCFDGGQHRIHNLVGEAFPEICGVKEPGKHLHHLNEDQKDNRAVNLRYMSASEHKSLHQREDGVSVPVIAYNKNGEKVGEYASAHKAARELGCDYRHISDIVHHRGRRFTHKGYYFFAKDEEPEDILTIIEAIKSDKADHYANCGKNAKKKV